ncbi:endonuclease/exonuclease/phosphatase family protein [Planctomicrobium sp. SH527]|uniref:endonuclease/exonuclease/phosphatase family protein n=1 Tax=Planctomicrobium sp. SH527 TaxID=3448123 RepID=UPI003F5C9711
MARRLATELALYEPDIINFSESPSEAIAKEVAEYLGMNHVRFPSGGSWPGTLLSRFEITDSMNVPLGSERPKELFTRHWGKGTVKLPNGESLIVHSAHLFPRPEPEVRLKEIKAMLGAMKEDLSAGRSMLLIGDLNHRPDTEEYKLWIDAGWVDTFAKVGKGDGWTIKADQPQSRIDYIMAAGPIANEITESRPLFEGAFRLNIADENSFALSDHLPQLAVFGSSK